MTNQASGVKLRRGWMVMGAVPGCMFGLFLGALLAIFFPL